MSFLEPDFNVIKGLIEFFALLRVGDDLCSQKVNIDVDPLNKPLGNGGITRLMKNSGNPG